MRLGAVICVASVVAVLQGPADLTARHDLRKVSRARCPSRRFAKRLWYTWRSTDIGACSANAHLPRRVSAGIPKLNQEREGGFMVGRRGTATDTRRQNVRSFRICEVPWIPDSDRNSFNVRCHGLILTYRRSRGGEPSAQPLLGGQRSAE